jgi:hypothetical protein
MSLFDEGTVIIVGAGASVPFGLPTGIGMFDEMVALLENEINQARGNSYHDATVVPFLATIATDPSSFGKTANVRVAAERLLEKLKLQTSDTIDDFIVQNPDEAKLCKALICWTLLWCLLKPGGGHLKEVGNYHARTLYARKPRTQLRGQKQEDPAPRRNWIHQLINIARDQYQSKPEGAKIKIVSFNYDTILEQILSAQWNNVQRDYGEWQESFEILHPHGSIAIPASGRRDVNVGEYILKWANNISVARESDVPRKVVKDRDRSKAIIERSTMVYAIGFAFARSNCDLLGIGGEFFKHEPFVKQLPRHISFINFDGSFGLRDRVHRYCDLRLREFMGKLGLEFKPELGGQMHIDQALIAGFLGEMPS